MSVAAVSCSEKKQPSNIIAHKPVKKAPSAPVKMQNSDYEDAVSWIGSSYNVKISRRSDTGLPLIVDDSGNKYYDNVITLSVVRPDGSEFSTASSPSLISRHISVKSMQRRAPCSALCLRRQTATT